MTALSESMDFDTWYESVKKEVEQIDILIAAPRSHDCECLFNELDVLLQWLARSAELVSIAESEFKQKLGKTIIENMSKEISTNLLLKIAEGKCGKELQKYRRIERQNAGLVHAIDGIRTLLSYQKETMKMNNVSQGNKYDKTK